MLAYVGPEVMLPAASAAAAILGGVLFAWRWIASIFSRVWGWMFGKRSAPDGSGPATGSASAPLTAPIPPVEAGRPAAPRQASSPER